MNLGLEQEEHFFHQPRVIHFLIPLIDLISKLTRIAGNRVFESVLRTVYANFDRYYNQFLPKEVQILKKSIKAYGELKQAIEKKDANETLISVKNHLRQFNSMIRKVEKEELGGEESYK